MRPNGFTSELELQWLEERALFRLAIVEIGCWVGRSTTALAKTPGFVLCVDDWSGDPSKGFLPTDIDKATMARFPSGGLLDFVINMQPLLGKVIPLRMKSQDASVLFPVPCFDMIFIDGDHRYISVAADIILWKDVLKSGGLLCGHNYEPCWKDDVVKAVDELVPNRNLVPNTSLWWAIK